MNPAGPGQCFFIFGSEVRQEIMTEGTAKMFCDAMSGQIGPDYRIDGFKTYTVDGVTVTRLDYTWGNGGAIAQSLVKVYFDDHDVVIQYATLTTIPNTCYEEFDEIMATMGIVK